MLQAIWPMKSMDEEFRRQGRQDQVYDITRFSEVQAERISTSCEHHTYIPDILVYTGQAQEVFSRIQEKVVQQRMEAKCAEGFGVCTRNCRDRRMNTSGAFSNDGNSYDTDSTAALNRGFHGIRSPIIRNSQGVQCT